MTTAPALWAPSHRRTASALIVHPMLPGVLDRDALDRTMNATPYVPIHAEHLTVGDVVLCATRGGRPTRGVRVDDIEITTDQRVAVITYDTDERDALDANTIVGADISARGAVPEFTAHVGTLGTIYTRPDFLAPGWGLSNLRRFRNAWRDYLTAGNGHETFERWSDHIIAATMRAEHSEAEQAAVRIIRQPPTTKGQDDQARTMRDQ